MPIHAPPPQSPSAQNHLLDCLPRLISQRLAKHVEPVELTYGQVLYEPGSHIQYVYFPYGSLISLLSVVGPGKAAEVAVVGNEGVVGGCAAVGIEISYFRAVVQVTGTAARIPASHMRAAFRSHGAWDSELLHFNYALMNQIAQTAACNRFHTVEARLARWLLTTCDRAYSHRFYVTHEFLSHILGVRRVGVSAAAAKLQKGGLISYSRGNIELLDPIGLHACACGCYQVIKAMYFHTKCNPTR